MKMLGDGERKLKGAPAEHVKTATPFSVYDSSLGFAITFTGVPPGAWFGEGTVLKREVYRYNIEPLRRSVVGRSHTARQRRRSCALRQSRCRLCASCGCASVSAA